MEFGSLFAGIRGFDLALTRAGMRSVYAAEREADCNSVALRHFPTENQVNEVAAVSGGGFRTDLVCAGWPCQGNSVAGRRAGMADERSGLWWEVVRILAEQRPRWFLGENVPGLLSVNGGRDFGAILGSLAELGYGFAYRILDAQWFGVPQRRRRVFIVGYLGDWRRPAEILFERESLPWDSPPRRETRTRVAASLTRGADSGGRGGYAGRRREDDVNLVAGTVCSSGNGNETGGVPFTIHGTDTNGKVASPDDVAQCIRTRAPGSTENSSTTVVQSGYGVRRLMPIECERLQGFPDGWTRYGADGEEIADAARYRMLGNAVAVPAVEWIGRRIVAMEETC